MAVRDVSGLRIAVVCPYAMDVPGGVQQHAHGLSAHLREGGWEPGHVVEEADGERTHSGPGHDLREHEQRVPPARRTYPGDAAAAGARSAEPPQRDAARRGVSRSGPTPSGTG